MEQISYLVGGISSDFYAVVGVTVATRNTRNVKSKNQNITLTTCQFVYINILLGY